MDDHAKKVKSVPLAERWALDREMFMYDEVVKADGTVEKVETSIPINGWIHNPDGTWTNERLGMFNVP
ncbi:MAG: hypothetical protein LBB86_07505 [Oscillospiraceae bacterium]|nr:hypothetical protein [Oscillospiraceae bacterium]